MHTLRPRGERIQPEVPQVSFLMKINRRKFMLLYGEREIKVPACGDHKACSLFNSVERARAGVRREHSFSQRNNN